MAAPRASKSPPKSATKSVVRLEDKEVIDREVETMMGAAILTKARRKLDDAEVAAHNQMFRSVIREFGLKAFTRAFWQTMTNEDGFPTSAAIRRYILQSIGEVVPGGASRNCGKCQDGWVVGHWKVAGVTKKRLPIMRRCECKGGAPVDWAEQKRGLAA